MTTKSTFFGLNGLCDDITNPFYYTQEDTDKTLEPEYKKQDQSHVVRKVEDKKIRKFKKHVKPSLSKKMLNSKQTQPCTSYIKKRVEKGQRLIKINVYDIGSTSFLFESDATIDEPNNVLSVQYVFEDGFDEIKSMSENLVEKIVKKLSLSETVF